MFIYTMEKGRQDLALVAEADLEAYLYELVTLIGGIAMEASSAEASSSGNNINKICSMALQESKARGSDIAATGKLRTTKLEITTKMSKLDGIAR